MARLIWTDPALEDLEAIADYIGLDKPRAAAKFVRHIFAKVELLRRFPQIGSVPTEMADLPYRQLIVPPCRVFLSHRGKEGLCCARYETGAEAPSGKPRSLMALTGLRVSFLARTLPDL